ncbi:hypothetical protein [Pseudomonas sp. zfem005]|uniref:hypothetical protein n=1 Tax=Pseudomonas sp. zfem005 TaxID=3078200 RepID=UPI0029289256|nr:hypothetical protein [Pseudomonas sp. zfem005]MDU9415193.1 hypothetical protein [Pseudomonas sp. zfem005]
MTTLQILSGIACTVAIALTFYAGYRAGLNDGQVSGRIEAHEELVPMHQAEVERLQRANTAQHLVSETDRDAIVAAVNMMRLSVDTFAGLRANDKANGARWIAGQLEKIATRTLGHHPDTDRVDYLERMHTGNDYEDVAVYIPVGPDYDGANSLRDIIDHSRSLQQAEEVRDAA